MSKTQEQVFVDAIEQRLLQKIGVPMKSAPGKKLTTGMIEKAAFQRVLDQGKLDSLLNPTGRLEPSRLLGFVRGRTLDGEQYRLLKRAEIELDYRLMVYAGMGLDKQDPDRLKLVQSRLGAVRQAISSTNPGKLISVGEAEAEQYWESARQIVSMELGRSDLPLPDPVMWKKKMPIQTRSLDEMIDELEQERKKILIAGSNQDVGRLMDIAKRLEEYQVAKREMTNPEPLPWTTFSNFRPIRLDDDDYPWKDPVLNLNSVAGEPFPVMVPPPRPATPAVRCAVCSKFIKLGEDMVLQSDGMIHKSCEDKNDKRKKEIQETQGEIVVAVKAPGSSEPKRKFRA